MDAVTTIPAPRLSTIVLGVTVGNILTVAILGVAAFAGWKIHLHSVAEAEVRRRIDAWAIDVQGEIWNEVRWGKDRTPGTIDDPPDMDYEHERAEFDRLNTAWKQDPAREEQLQQVIRWGADMVPVTADDPPERSYAEQDRELNLLKAALEK